MNAFPISPQYIDLLSRVPPKIIRNEEENEQYTQALYELEQRSVLSPEERELSDLLTLLIEDFEERRYRLPCASQAELVEFLAEQHGLEQSELAQLIDSPDDILSARRELTTAEIRALSKRFHVSPEVFF